MLTSKAIKIFCFGLGLAFTAAGCVPVTVVDLPDIEGVVRDGTTNTPIGNADVVITPKTGREFEAHATSDASGRFKITEITHTAWDPPLPIDRISPSSVVSIWAAGYARQQFFEVFWPNDHVVTFHLNRL